MNTYEEVLHGLEKNLKTLEMQEKAVVTKLELGISLSKQAVYKLRNQVLTSGFEDEEMECLFFKTVKPNVVGYLIFYITLAEIEKYEQICDGKAIFKYMAHLRKKIQVYFNKHREFYEYLLLNRTERDKEYFVRGNTYISFHPDSIYYCTDSNFCTSHDMVAAKIKAYTLLIKSMETPSSGNNVCKLPIHYGSLSWTGNKVDLIELLYALQTTASINYGNMDIKQLAHSFEIIFDINLGDIYHTYLELRSRKINQTKFLDRLKKKLADRMYDADG